MTKRTLIPGIQVELPDDFLVVPSAPVTTNRGGQKFPASGAISLPGEDTGGSDPDAWILPHLQASGMELMHELTVEPGAGAAAIRGMRGTAEDKITLTVDTDPGENAVILFEQDGLYLWKYPGQPPADSTDQRTLRGIPGQSYVFEITIGNGAQSQPGDDKRGIILDKIKEFAIGKIKAYVMKFVADKAVGAAAKWLEKDVSRGIVQVNGSDPTTWELMPGIPRHHGTGPGGSPKVLLFVHGTFSSTKAAFGDLGHTPWGKSLLSSAFAEYDLMIGFDHATLTEDPIQNARQLLDQLEAFSWSAPPTVDIVAHSRGGLVVRCLLEILLPQSTLHPVINRVVFVACTNAGTLLAEPANWEHLVNLYTNLITGACRVATLIAPQAAVVTTILSTVVKNIGSFVKYLAGAAITDAGMPGLAAMEPASELIKEINNLQQAQPGLATGPYYIITSDFKPSLTGDQLPKELPKRFLELLLADFSSQLMKTDGDLVVNLDSMDALDNAAGENISARLDFGTNPQVYHTNYFTRPEVAGSLADWFGIARTGALANLRELGPDNTGLRGPVDRRGPVDPPQHAVPDAAALARLVTRLADHANLQAEQRRLFQEWQDTQSRDQQSQQFQQRQQSQGQEQGEGQGEGRSQDDGQSQQPKPSPILPASSRKAGYAIDDRGIDTLFTGDNELHYSAAPKVLCYFQAAMDAETVVKHATTLVVTVSREAIAAIVGQASEEGQAEVDPNQKILLRVLPQSGFIITDANDGREEIDLPQAGKPHECFVDMKATAEGEGLIWILVRQGAVNILKLTLHPKVVATATGAAVRISVKEAAIEPAKLWKPLNQLWIEETKNADGFFYKFDIRFEQLGVQVQGRRYMSKVIAGKKEDYIKRLYDTIENRWTASKQDKENFDAELRAYGAELFRELFPPELQKILWDLRDKLQSIQVLSAEPFIPWEFVHLCEPGQPGMPEETIFLAQIGLVRWLDGAGKNGWPAEELLLRSQDRIRFVIPDYPAAQYRLPEAQEEKKLLQVTYKAMAVTAESGDIRKLVSRPGQFDILHFACHGEADSASIGESMLLMQGRIEDQKYVVDTLGEKTIAQYARLATADGNGPMIYLNACQTGRQGYKLTGVGGFADAFLRAGASVFIGALWSIGDETAMEFCRAFYASLWAGHTLTEAAIAARNEARKMGDATWLAYVIYGHPHFRIKTQDPI